MAAMCILNFARLFEGYMSAIEVDSRTINCKLSKDRIMHELSSNNNRVWARKDQVTGVDKVLLFEVSFPGY